MTYFKIRGVIEGFYGRPWSWAERDRMVDFMGQHGYNVYVYGPKNDPIHRGRWREPYLPEEIDRFAKLARRCEEKGIDFVFGTSPLEYHYSSQEYWDVLISKLLPLYERGVRSFTVLLDDMPDKFRYPDDGERFGSLAGAQAWLNNRVLEHFEALGGLRKLMFCPTEYHGQGASPYLEALGEKMRPEIEIFWTGTDICSPTLRTEDARRVSASLKRPVLYWDNYPVNDLDMRFHPHIRPIQGRDADLYTACSGIVANGALQPEITKIALYTYGQYFADPHGYEPEAAWKKAALDLCGNERDAEAVLTLGDLARWSDLERGRGLYNTLAPKLARFWQRWGHVPAAAGPDLDKVPPASDAAVAAMDRQGTLDDMAVEFRRLQEAAQRLLGPMENVYLQAELKPWSQKLAGWAEVGSLAVSVLSRALANPADPTIPALRDATLDTILSTRENFHWVGGDLVDQFARRCLWAADELKG